MEEQDIKLTKLTKCAGCGAKVGAGVLAQLLEGIRVHHDPNLLVGFDKSDDASVYKISDELALVQTVDFFPPIADDPYLFGQIAAVPGVDDDLLLAGDVEHNSSLRVQTQLLVVLDLGLGCVVNNEIRLKVSQLLSGGLDEHVGHEVCLPGHFHDETNGHAGVLVGTAEGIDHVQALVGQLLLCDLLDGIPGFLRSGVVVVLVCVAGPPHGVLGVLVHDDELILGGTAGVDAGHDIDSAQFADLALLEAFQTGLGLLFKQLLVRGIVHDLRRAGDTILAQIYLCHDTYTSSFVQIKF